MLSNPIAPTAVFKVLKPTAPTVPVFLFSFAAWKIEMFGVKLESDPAFSTQRAGGRGVARVCGDSCAYDLRVRIADVISSVTPSNTAVGQNR